MPGIICTASCVGFFKVLNERWEGKTFAFLINSRCQRKPGKMLKMSTEGCQQHKFILTS